MPSMLGGGEVTADALVAGTGIGFEGETIVWSESEFDFVLKIFSKILLGFIM